MKYAQCKDVFIYRQSMHYLMLIFRTMLLELVGFALMMTHNSALRGLMIVKEIVAELETNFNRRSENIFISTIIYNLTVVMMVRCNRQA